MSLMNQLLGFHPHCEVLLHCAGLYGVDIPRFIDVWMEKPDVIKVLARIGGANRPGYADFHYGIVKHPGFITEYDAPADNTYAIFEFAVVPTLKAHAARVFLKTEDKRDPFTRFFELVALIGDPTKKDDPRVINAMNIGKQILSPIVAQLQAGDTIEIRAMGRECTPEEKEAFKKNGKLIEV